MSTSFMSKPLEAISSWYQNAVRKNIYLINEGGVLDRNHLSLKGASLCELYRLGINVPPAFIISSENSSEFWLENDVTDVLFDELCYGIMELERKTSQKFGSVEGLLPLLLSIRVGSPIDTPDVTQNASPKEELDVIGFLGAPESWSFPGVQETILALGLNDNIVNHLAVCTSRRFALNTYAHFMLRFGSIVLGVPTKSYYKILADVVHKTGRNGSALTADDLESIVQQFKALQGIPENPYDQLRLAIASAYKNWYSSDAVNYRTELLNTREDLGVAVIVQATVYGGVGFCFSRNPISGDRSICGEYWPTTGVRSSFQDLKNQDPLSADEVTRICKVLETHFRDMQLVEFVINENGQISILQSRPARRTAKCSVKAAVDMVSEGILTEREAIFRVDATKINYSSSFSQPNIINYFGTDFEICFSTGVPASHGIATGLLALTPKQCTELSMQGEVIYVAKSVDNIDTNVLKSVVGVITMDGSILSDISLICRAKGICCVVGVRDIEIVEDSDGSPLRIVSNLTGSIINVGETCTLDGGVGKLYTGRRVMTSLPIDEDFKRIMDWCDKYRKLLVFAEIQESPDMLALNDPELSSDGIIVNTDWMFRSTEDRLSLTRSLLFSQAKGRSSSANMVLSELQREDFRQIFRKSRGKAVYVKLLDQSITSFLPKTESDIVFVAAQQNLSVADIKTAIKMWEDENPNMGLTGCRISELIPTITELQITAMMTAKLDVAEEGIYVNPKITISSVTTSREVDRVLNIIHAATRATMTDCGVMREVEDSSCDWLSSMYSVGIKGSCPRFCLRAETIAPKASFVLFNSTEMTQFIFGTTRQDSVKFLSDYLKNGIFLANPFKSLDDKGVGEVLKLGLNKCRDARPLIRCGLEGDHCFDPRSVNIIHDLGFDFICCPPSKLHVAKLCTAQAHIRATSALSTLAYL